MISGKFYIIRNDLCALDWACECECWCCTQFRHLATAFDTKEEAEKVQKLIARPTVIVSFPTENIMQSTYRQMSVDHMGCEATEADLEEFRSYCQKLQERNPGMTDKEATDLVWGDGDYHKNASRLNLL